MGREIPASDRKVIAAFDFDGTITKFDTLPYFIWHAVGMLRKIYGTALMVPSLFLLKLKVISNHKAKEKLFKIFFKGFDLAQFDKIADSFTSKIDGIINPAALEKLNWHVEMGHEVIIISASVENWIRPWAIKHGVTTVLATGLQLDNNVVTGKFLTSNCHGAEKVNRLLERYPDRENYTLYAYGDSNGDKELLAEADHAFYRSF